MSLNPQPLARVSVVIRSKGDAERKPLLRRAVESALSQTGVVPEIIVVLNGPLYDPEVLQWLRTEPRVVLRVLTGPDKPAATALGRSLVSSEFFSYLDDDDEYLPGALVRRASMLMQQPLLDCVATNGIYVVRGKPRIQYANTEAFAGEFRLPLLRGNNWMTSCGALFRASTVTQRYFDGLTKHCEWTLIAFRIASHLRVAFLDEPTFRIHSTSVSESKTVTYVETIPLVFSDMLRWNTEPRYERLIRRRRADALHDACSYHRINRDFKRAWTFHVKSILEGGWRHLLYTPLLLARCSLPVKQLIPVLRKRG